MSVSTSSIASYSVVHVSGNPDFDALILCRDAQDRQIATLNFLKDGHAVPPNVASVVPRVFFPASRFNDVITTLRYEKPVEFQFDTSSLRAQVGALLEPIGEQEG
jgi:hypothetical protein